MLKFTSQLHTQFEMISFDLIVHGLNADVHSMKTFYCLLYENKRERRSAAFAFHAMLWRVHRKKSLKVGWYDRSQGSMAFL
jgi:hypothetical protein